ncbi:Rz1 family lipoprotein [Xenorhabdus hominickii]|uniref:Rz1 family lipoprotein n=1 Tax=Xenorhabdus hominickii TaxID=351679 RepID=UPI003BB74FB6
MVCRRGIPLRNSPMPRLKSILFWLMLPLLVASCVSKPSVPCLKPLPLAAWATQEPHNLQKQLDKIISISSE